MSASIPQADDADQHRRRSADLWDDFAFATRDGLIPEVRRSTDPAAVRARGLNAPFAEIAFDFVLHPENTAAPNVEVTRAHAEAA